MNQSESTFHLLGKLLTEERTPLQSQKAVEDQYAQLLESVTANLYPIINNSGYENKTKLIVDVKDALQEIEFLISLPQLSHKTLVLVKGDKKSVPNWFTSMGMSNFADFVRQNHNVPVIFYQNDELTIQSQNELGNRADLTKDDYSYANRKLYQHQIQVQDLINAYYVGTNSPYEHIVFIYIPPYAEHYQPIYELFHRLAQFTILVNPTVYQLKNHKSSENSSGNYIITERTENIPQGYQILPSGQALSWMEQNNVPLYNGAFSETFRSCFYDYMMAVTEMIASQQQLVNALSKDLITVSDETLEANICEIRDHLRTQLQKDQLSHKNVLKQFEEHAKQAEQLEGYFLEVNGMEDRPPTASKRVQLQTAKWALLAKDLEGGNEVQRELGKLIAWESPYTPFVKAYKHAKMTTNELRRQSEVLGPLNTVTARVLLHSFSKNNDQVIYQKLVDYYRYIPSAEIAYELGLAAEAQRERQDAEKYFKIAMSLGHRSAAKSYTSYVSKQDIRELEKMANLLVPVANYEVGIHYYNHHYTKTKGMMHLKMAAAFDYLPAIEKLSEVAYSNYTTIKNRNKLNADALEKMFLNALKLNQYVVQRKPSNVLAKERLGKLYYFDEDYRKAEPLLKEVNNADANFLCGRMYQYGKVFAQDLDKAKSYFQKSIQQGHHQASIEYDKVLGWIKSNQSKHTYNSTNSYQSSSSTSYSGSSSSFCFLTTATCIALGKEDNCEEILAYKSYRDQHLRFDEDGRDLIVEYYRIAPILVDKINALPHAKDIYVDLYNRYIQVGYGYLNNNDLKKAKATYIDLVKELCEKFDIVPFE